MKHTKGEWKHQTEERFNIVSFKSQHPEAIGYTHFMQVVHRKLDGYDPIPIEEQRANAKLIAKAPEMYRVLELLFNKCHHDFLEISEGDEAYNELQKLMIGK